MLGKDDKKIFAGLGLGNYTADRDCCDLVKIGQHKGRVKILRGEIFVNSGDSYAFYNSNGECKFDWNDLEVIGIQK